MLTCVTLRGCWEISVSLARLCDAQWSLLDTVQHCTSAATRLRAFSVKWKCEIIRFIWFVTAVIRYYKLNVFFGATISAEFSSQYRLLHLGERLWGLNLTPEINTFLRCCGCHNLHKSDWSPCNKIQISESLQTFFFDLLKHSWEQIILVLLFFFFLSCRVFEPNSVYRPERVYMVLTILMSMGSTGPESLRCEKKGICKTKWGSSSEQNRLTSSEAD